MRNLLSRLRISIIENNIGRKYLLYAIGEIFLVMIGILLALQINNWNEDRKDRLTERKILQELAENLEINAQSLKGNIQWTQSLDKSSEMVLNVIEQRLPYHDSLDTHFATALTHVDGSSLTSQVAFESLKNIGFNIIRNEDLQKEIIYLFEQSYQGLNNTLLRSGAAHTTILELQHRFFLRKPGYRYKPHSYNEVLNNAELHSWMWYVKDTRLWLNGHKNRSLVQTEKVLKLIQEELGRLD